MKKNKETLSRDILSDITVYGKYGKYLPLKRTREQWSDITLRNMEMHTKKYPHLANEIAEAYSYVLSKNVFPSMRALEDSTPIKTKKGWSTAGNIKIGDVLYSSDGLETNVIGVRKFKNKQLFKVSFSDKSSLTACDEHLWIISTNDDLKNNKTRVVDTKYLRTHLKQGSKNNIVIHNPNPIHMEEKKLYIDPYILGHWLGDGYSNGVQLSTSVEDAEFITNEYKLAGYNTIPSDSSNIWTHSVYGLKCDLTKYNLINNKHIPDDYINSSIRQRLDIIQGLMDSDGHITPDGRCCFHNTNMSIINGLKEILASLGIKYTSVTVPKKREHHKDAIVISFFTTLQVSRMPRKSKHIRSVITNPRTQRRHIIDIESVGVGNASCFHVDSHDHSFLAGKRMITTHNSMQFGGLPIELSPNRMFNCYKKSTRFITKNGVSSFEDFEHGDKIIVPSHTGKMQNAIVRSYGTQTFNKVTLVRAKVKKELEVTSDHKWLLRDGTETTNLKKGDVILGSPKIFQNFSWVEASPMEKLYWCYGFVYGDGTRVTSGNNKYSMVRLCGDDFKYLPRFKEMGFKSSEPNSCNGDTIVYTGKYQKTSPNPDIDDHNMIKAFVVGYLDADGSKNPDWYINNDLSPYKSIQSSEKDHIKFIEQCFESVGFYITSEKDLTGQKTNYGTRPFTKTFRLSTKVGTTNINNHWVVESIVPSISKDTAWCLEVEEDHSFILSGGIVTGNCSTLACDNIASFNEAMFLLLGGSGVGVSVQKHHVEELPELTGPKKRQRRYLVSDSIEG